MEKPKIRIYDNQFPHSQGGSFGTGPLNIHPTHFEWSWDDFEDSKIAVLTESMWHMVDTVKEKIKVALLLETSFLANNKYHWISNPDNYNKFDLILTHHDYLLSLDPKFKHYNFGGSWIKKEDWQIYPKTKHVSIIVSEKRTTGGQELRHEVVEQLAKEYKIDVYGRGYNPIDYKLDALKDYKYSIVIENQAVDTFWTEKIHDCFACGTIPIYVGTKNIMEYFDRQGILFAKDMYDIQSHLIHIRSGLQYESMFEAVKDNFNLFQKFTIPEDAIWENYLKQLL